MAKYKVLFSGFAYLEAGSCDEAEDLYLCDEYVYEKMRIDSVEEIDDLVFAQIEEALNEERMEYLLLQAQR